MIRTGLFKYKTGTETTHIQKVYIKSNKGYAHQLTFIHTTCIEHAEHAQHVNSFYMLSAWQPHVNQFQTQMPA